MAFDFPNKGRVGALISSSVKDNFVHFSSQINGQEKLMVITRLSPRRLIRHVNLENIDFRWLTMQESPHSIDPSLEHTNHLINSTIQSGNGMIWIDGLEYLSDRQGFDAVHSFVRNLVDSINNSDWSVIIAIEEKTFDEMQIAQITREAKRISFELNNELELEEINNDEPENYIEMNKTIQTEGLKLLTKISREGFTQKTLRERIIQWRNMDLDVSILEPALSYQDSEESYKLYSEVEELVRKAVELDLRLDILKEKGDSAKAFAYKYRIRQLTGLEEISRIVDTLLSN